MPYEEDLPNLFANLASLVVAGKATPGDLATIWSTGKLPEPEPSGPTLADLEEQFAQTQVDTYTDILSSTGDPHQAGIIASAQSQEAINDAVNQSMINILAKDENKISLAADAVMSYEGPLDPDMNVADIVAPIYGVSPTKVEAVLKTQGALAESWAKPFYDMDIGQDIVVEPETIDITKPVSMAGDPGFNQVIDMQQEIDPSTGQTFAPSLIEQKRAWDPTNQRTWKDFYAEVHPDVEMPGSPWADVGEKVWGALTQDWSEISEEQRQIIIQQQQLKANNGQAVDPFPGQPPETVPTPIAPAAPETGVIADAPGVAEQRALNDEIILGKIREVQRIFEDFNAYQYNPGGVSSGPGAPDFTDDYFRNLIKSYIDSPEGQASTYADLGPEHFMGGWGENQRFVQVVTGSEAETGMTTQGQPTTTVTTQITEAPAGPLQGTLVDADTAWPTLNKIRDRQFDYFVSPEGLSLWADPEKNLWGTQAAPDGTEQLISYGAMVKGITQANGTQYTLGGHTWLHNPESPIPWQLQGAQPAAAMGGGGALPLQSTLGGMTPTKQWETLRAQEMGEDIWNPVRWGTRMQGFQPAYGQYLLSGQQFASPFHEFVQSGAAPDTALGWQELVQASAGLTSPLDITGVDPTALGRQIGYGGLLQGDAGRTNAILMASAAMGAGQGMGAQALRGQLGSMYDVHAAQAAAAGQPAGGFIDWLNQQITPGSMPGTGL
jgi:hypothetical protein